MPEDMRIPERTTTQIGIDQGSTAKQTAQLGEDELGTPNPDLDEVLLERRAQSDGAVTFETYTRGGAQTIVVPRQILLANAKTRDAGHEVLMNRQWKRIAPSEDVPSDEDPCGKLHDRVWVYSFDSGDDVEARNEVDAALADLEANGARGARHGVNALHMVVKSADGPAPTAVTIADFSPQELDAVGQITVAVIDTGIDGHDRGDGWLDGIATNADNTDQLDAFDHPGRLDFGAGHGTFAAGIVRQVDPHARIVVYRALESDGLGTEDAVACAMIQAADDGAQVINLSLGMPRVDGKAPKALKQAVRYIQSLPDPPAIVASAGNNGTEEKIYPAAFPGVVSVAALRAVKKPGITQPPPKGAKWSSRGAWVRCSAVGEGIVSTFVEGHEDVFKKDVPGVPPDYTDCDDYPTNAWAVWSGTSFAAPQIAAHIAKRCRVEGVPPLTAVADLFPTTGLPADGYGTRVVLLEGTRPNT